MKVGENWELTVSGEWQIDGRIYSLAVQFFRNGSLDFSAEDTRHQSFTTGPWSKTNRYSVEYAVPYQLQIVGFKVNNDKLFELESNEFTIND